MGKKKSSFIEKALGRIDRLDSESIHAVVGRLAQERQFLETLFDAIHDGVVVVDQFGNVLYFNRAATDLIGLPEEGVLGEAVTRFIPSLDWEAIIDHENRGLSGSSTQEIEISYPRERYIEVVSTAIDGDQEGAAGVVLLFHDATESRKETYEAIESERVQALTLLAASVAHEIGNPLHALHIHLQLIEREVAKLTQSGDANSEIVLEIEDGAHPGETNSAERTSVQKLSDYLRVARGEVKRLDLIVREFLQAIRPVPPKLALEDVNDVLEQTLELMRPELEDRGLEVIDERCDKPAKALIDTDQIQQVLVNLIKNAMQAMTRGGQLTIRTNEEDEGISVVVEDTGTGISQDTIEKVFKPYFTTKKKGTGLGLMIVHRIINGHGGRIHVESGKQRGTRFYIWLPREELGPRLLTTAD
tara:strand:- start:1 stop:1251 length:1251 start_codon:yes stop_codon:yes gene_type:complete